MNIFKIIEKYNKFHIKEAIVAVWKGCQDSKINMELQILSEIQINLKSVERGGTILLNRIECQMYVHDHASLVVFHLHSSFVITIVIK